MSSEAGTTIRLDAQGRPLGRDIAWALLLKLVLLTVLYLIFFRGDQRPAIDDAAAAEHLVGVAR